MEELLDHFSIFFTPMMNEWQTSLTMFVIGGIFFAIFLYHQLKKDAAQRTRNSHPGKYATGEAPEGYPDWVSRYGWAKLVEETDDGQIHRRRYEFPDGRDIAFHTGSEKNPSKESIRNG